MERIPYRRTLAFGLLVVGLVILAAPTATADLMPAPDLFNGNPVQFNSIEQPMPMSYSENALSEGNHMVMPQSMLQGYVSQPPPTDAEQQASEGSLLGVISLRMILAGLLLSAAAISLGVVLQRKNMAKTAVAGLLIGAGLLATIEYSPARQAVADLLPPTDRPQRETESQHAEEEIVEAIEAGESLTIEFAEEGEVIQFIRGTKPAP